MSGDLALMKAPSNLANTHVPYAATPNMERMHAPAIDLSRILYKVVTPYRPEAWKQALIDADLMHIYPNLVHDLTHGSLIGNTPPICFTFIPKNLPSANIQPEYISNLIAEEVAAGRMDGPYTIEQAHAIYQGHFRTCPLGLGEKPGSTALCMIRHFSKEDKFGDSTNSWVGSVDFPTRWFTAAQAADFVSFDLVYLPQMPSLPVSVLHMAHFSLYYFISSLLGCGSCGKLSSHMQVLCPGGS